MAIERAPRRYVALAGSHINNSDAEVVGPELDAIYLRDGGVTPAAVVERAKTTGTILNAWDRAKNYFEWDDDKAAAAYREGQARRLVKAIVVKVDNGEETLSSRAYYSIRHDARARTYVPVESIAADAEFVQQVRDRFHNELIRIDKDYRAFMRFAEFAQAYGPVFEAIDRAGVKQETPKRKSRRERAAARS